MDTLPRRPAALALLAALLLVAGGAAWLEGRQAARDRALIADLASPDGQRGARALQELWRREQAGDPVSPALARTLEHPSPRARARALKAVAKLGLSAFSDRCAALLVDPSETVRVQAALALREFRGYRDPAPLIRALSDPTQSDRIRASLAWSLARRRVQAAAAPLTALAAWTGGSERLRGEAILALGCLGDPRSAAILAPLALDPQAPPELRRRAAQALGRLPDPGHQPPLRELLSGAGHPPAVRGEAALALVRHASHEDLRALERAARDPQAPLLLRLKAARAVHDLGRTLSDMSGLVRRGLASQGWRDREAAAALARAALAVELLPTLKEAAARERSPKARCALDEAVGRLQAEGRVDPDQALEAP